MSTEPGSTSTPSKFVIFALPRSRTAWLARFLTYGEWSCGHEEARFLRSVDDIRAWAQTPFSGTAETAVTPFWRTLLKVRPDARVVVVRRPVEGVVESLMRFPIAFNRADLTRLMVRMDRKLDQIERRVPGALSVQFADLANEATCARVFEHCLPYSHNPEWWAALSTHNIQCHLPGMIRYMHANAPQLEKLAAQVRCMTLADFEKRPLLELDNLTLSVEPFDSFYRDAQKAISAHLLVSNQLPEPGSRNIELMRDLDRYGVLQCVTARCNGRVFGYLMTVIGPSLDSRDVLTGVHMPFYADPSFPGLGMRLQRFARDALKQRGVTEIVFRAGTRADGPRIGALYRRLGAEDHGQLYRLDLET